MSRGVQGPQANVARGDHLVILQRTPAGVVIALVAPGPGELVERRLGPPGRERGHARDVVAVGVGDEHAIEGPAQTEVAGISEGGGNGLEVLVPPFARIDQRGLTREDEVGPVALAGEGTWVVCVERDDVHARSLWPYTVLPLSGEEPGIPAGLAAEVLCLGWLLTAGRCCQ